MQFNASGPLSIQMSRLYKLRFIIAAEICKSRGLLGGISSQFNFPGILVDIDIVDNPPIAMKYDESPPSKIAVFLGVARRISIIRGGYLAKTSS